MSHEEDAVKLMANLLAHVRQIVGDGASYAMLHYGAVEEGKRLGTRYGAADTLAMLAKVDTLLGHRTEIMRDEGDVVTVRLLASRFLAEGQRPAQGILVGLVEGALTASRQARYRASVLAGARADELVIELRKQ